MTTPLGLTVPRSPAALAARRIGRLHAQSGVGLIEVLVAVLVLSIGFLGIAALQAMSLSTNNSDMARSMATIASYSIMDAMRADQEQKWRVGPRPSRPGFLGGLRGALRHLYG